MAKAANANQVYAKVEKSLAELKKDTIQPLEFKADPFSYYYSNQDHILNYQDATQFCTLWGGQLLVLSSEAEQQTITKAFPERSMWYGSTSTYSFSNITHTPTTSTSIPCPSSTLESPLTLKSAPCNNPRPFICRKLLPSPLYPHDTELLL